MKSLLWLTFVILLFSPRLKAAPVRDELSRYTLLRDRTIVERQIGRPSDSTFFDLDMMISAKTLKLIGEVRNGSNSSLSSAQRQANMLEILNKNINTERFIDLDVALGIPIPDIKTKKRKFSPSLFFQNNFGVMATISNRENIADPKLQTYVKKESKIGLHTIYQPQKNQRYFISLYQLTRADTADQLTSSQLANDGKFFNFNKLNQKYKTLNLNLRWHYQKEGRSFLIEFQELQLYKQSGRQNIFGTRLLGHTQYAITIEGGHLQWQPFGGVHYRKRYSISQGLYGGFKAKLKHDNPFSLGLKLDNHFAFITPQFRLPWFHFSYSYKTPYRNPQDDIWVHSLHSIHLSLPFP